MLNNDILNALKGYAQHMQHPVEFVLQTGTHAKRDELKRFLNDIASVDPKIRVVELDAGLRSPISFSIRSQGEHTGILFSGIPSGHEFNSLVLAMLQAAGSDIKLDGSLKQRIAAISEPLHFEVFISLSCHNCPDVVQALNQFALLNPAIRSEMIDGGLFQDEINQRDIQGVPSVYLNGELFANGKVTAAELVDKLLQRSPQLAENPSAEALPLQDVTVVGGGPAGVSAAIYSARKGLKVTLVADRLGGQVKDTMDIENLISVSKTTGPELSNALAAHLADYDVTLKEHLKVNEVSDDKIKRIHLSSGEVINSKTVIVATGAKWRELGVPGEKENIGNGVAYCPHCDGPFFKGKDIAVVGGGNSGVEAALDLAGIVKHVHLFEFLPALKADKVLVEQLKKRSNVTIHTNAATDRIEATNGKVSSLVYTDRVTGVQQTQPLEGVFVQIGLVPNSAFLAEIVNRTRFGEVEINEKCETSAAGIYAAGDVSTVPYKQIVVAMGEGAKASLSAFEYLLAHGDDIEQQATELSHAA